MKKSFLNITVVLICGVSLIVLIIGNMTYARGNANMIKDTTQMMQLHGRIVTYQHDHAGQFPVSLTDPSFRSLLTKEEQDFVDARKVEYTRPLESTPADGELFRFSTARGDVLVCTKDGRVRAPPRF